jgi:peroxiredoxin
MRKILPFVFALLPFAAVAQTPFTIKATGEAYNDGDRIYLSYRVEGAKMADSTVVVNHAFEFKGNVKGLGAGFISRNDNPWSAKTNILHDSFDIYIEPGLISLTSPDSLKNSVISGTINNEDHFKLKTALRSLQQQYIKVNDEFDALTPAQQKNIDKVAEMREKLRKINSDMAPIKFAFIKSHPGSHVSLVTLRQMINSANIYDVEQAYNNLTKNARESKVGTELGKVIAAAKQSSSGVIAKEFTLPDQKGQPVSLSDFKGKYKYVLVDFWASWCMPCRQENPNLIVAYNKYKEKGFTVLGVSIDDDKEKRAWLSAIQEDGLPWPQVLDGKADKDKIKTLYGITTIPANVLVDSSGRIVATNLKDKALLNKLDELFSRLVNK